MSPSRCGHSTRRRALLFGGALGSVGLSGCLGLSNPFDSKPGDRKEVVVTNRTSETQALYVELVDEDDALFEHDYLLGAEKRDGSRNFRGTPTEMRFRLDEPEPTTESYEPPTECRQTVSLLISILSDGVEVGYGCGSGYLDGETLTPVERSTGP